jgi:16S rRNA processing protein RimM
VTEPPAGHLVVGRLNKPHGLKGECTVFPLTDEPERVFATGRSVWVMGLDGAIEAGPLVIARSRPFHRKWLIGFQGRVDREAVDGWRDRLLTMPAQELRPLEQDEVYLHELAGFAVVGEDARPLGVVSEVEELPGGLTLVVQGPKREFLLPFRKEFVRSVERDTRRLVVQVPEGLTEG